MSRTKEIKKGKTSNSTNAKQKKNTKNKKIDTVFLTAFVYNELIKQERKP